MAEVRTSIIVRAFNEEKHIGRLFTGISQQNISDFEVILVDSGSTDATIAIASAVDWQFPVIIVRIEPEQFSFGRSLNLGISEAHGEFIVIASAHVYPVYPDWLVRLLSPFENPKIGLTYGKQRGNASTRLSEQQIFAHWYPEHSKTQQNNPFCNNANAAIRRNLWQEHHYDETLSGLEDLEWAQWATEQNHSISYVAEAEIIHIHEDSPKGIYNRYLREAMAFKRIFPQEKFNFWDFIRLLAGNATSDLDVAIKDGKIHDEIWTIFWFRLMQFWGTYQGYKQSGPLTRELRKTFYYPTDLKSRTIQSQRNVNPIQYNDLS
jgi:glycosyltransferase involved in cell wall biosynthesis